MQRKLKKLWMNEQFQTALTIVILLMAIFGCYFGAQLILGTRQFAFAVASTSMLPTLNIGDLIIVQKIDPASIRADKLTGDVLVFKNPMNTEEPPIVHRAVKKEKVGNYFLITTLGDNMRGERDSFSPWNSSLLIGKVICRIPYLGNLSLLVRSNETLYIIFVALLIFLAAMMLSFGSGEHEKDNPDGRVQMIYLIAINSLLIGFLIFSLFANLTIPQPGATPPEAKATLLGMFQDVVFHKSFGYKAYLSQGFFTYRIDCMVNGGIRVGVETFAWYQCAIFTIIAYDAWKIYGFTRKRKAEQHITGEMESNNL